MPNGLPASGDHQAWGTLKGFRNSVLVPRHFLPGKTSRQKNPRQQFLGEGNDLLPGRLAAPASLGGKAGTKYDGPVRVLGDRGFRPVALIETAVFAEKFQPLALFFCPTVDLRHKTGTVWHTPAPVPLLPQWKSGPNSPLSH